MRPSVRAVSAGGLPTSLFLLATALCATALFTTALVGCEQPAVSLTVTLRTDYLPGKEFIAVETRIDEAEEGPLVAAFDGDTDFYAPGRRVAELPVLEANGSRRLRVRLLGRDGSLLAERVAVVDNRTSLAMSVVLTRDCSGVSCPDASGAAAEACLGGRCVEPECLTGREEACPEPACALGSDCAAPAACAEARCLDGVCVAIADQGACPPAAACDPTVGCGPYPGCDTGMADCDAQADNGCEAMLLSDPTHCGACGNTCAEGATCEAGRCSLTAVEVAAGYFDSCALRSDQSVVCWGSDESEDLRIEITSAVQIVSGGNHFCARLFDGTVACWGNNLDGQIGNGRTTLLEPVPVPVMGISSAVDISAGEDHTCALLDTGEAWCWGRNDDGQLGDGSLEDRLAPVQVMGLIGADEIAAGNVHTCARVGGEIRCWGRTGYLGEAEPSGAMGPVPVDGITDAIALSAWSITTCAILADRSARCWGPNSHGEVGDGSAEWRLSPVPVADLSAVTQITPGEDHSCALVEGGEAYCWGVNSSGQLGDLSREDRRTPVAVAALSEVTQISSGGDFNCAVRSDGSVWCWGENGETQLGDGTMSSRNLPVRTRGF